MLQVIIFTSLKTIDLIKYFNVALNFRTLLSALETTATQSLRLSLAQQLAEVLLRGMKGINYTVPEPPGSAFIYSAKISIHISIYLQKIF